MRPWTAAYWIEEQTYLEENIAALQIALSDAERAHLDAAFPPNAALGHRYSAVAQSFLNR